MGFRGGNGLGGGGRWASGEWGASEQTSPKEGTTLREERMSLSGGKGGGGVLGGKHAGCAPVRRDEE